MYRGEPLLSDKIIIEPLKSGRIHSRLYFGGVAKEEADPENS